MFTIVDPPKAGHFRHIKIHCRKSFQPIAIKIGISMCPEQTRIAWQFRLPNLRGRSFNDFFRGPRNRKAKCQNNRLERGRRLKFQFEKLKYNVKKDGSNRQKIQQTALEKWPPFYDQSTRNVLYNSSKSGNSERGATFSSHSTALHLYS